MQHPSRTLEALPPQTVPSDPVERRSWIKWQLDRRKVSLAKLSLSAGFARNAATLTLRLQWPEMEAIIAKQLGLEPKQLWPERYHEDGCPNVARATHYVRHTYPHWREHANRKEGPGGAI